MAAFTGNCFECKDTGRCHYCDRGLAVIAEQEERERQAAIREVIENAGLPRRFHDLTFATYPGTQGVEVEQFVTSWDGQRNLLLLGKYGVGKTGLIAAALNVVAPRYVGQYRYPFMFTSTVNLTDRLRAGYADGTFAETMHNAQTVKLLILDDLGAEKPTEWVQERLFAIIDHRYGNQLPIWATSNLSPDGLVAQIGERVFWRLAEECEVIQVNGKNLRMGKAA